MRSINFYSSFMAALPDIFYPRYRSTGYTVRMAGVLFTRPNSQLGKLEILPNRDYWHIRSGENIDFFWPGYTTRWEFDPKLFNEFVREFEAKTRWKYSGGSDLILLNVHFDPNSISEDKPCGRCRLDFNSAVLCQLDRMIRDEAILSVETFFQDIFKFAEQQPGGEAT